MTDSPAPHQNEETRRALLDQARHLSDEVEALRTHLALIPEGVLTGRPLGNEPSFKEIYALLALFDEAVYLPAVEEVAEREDVHVDPPEEEDLLGEGQWNGLDMEDIIERVRTARRRTVEVLEALPHEDWARHVVLGGHPTDVFGLVYGIIQHDAELLRAAAYRLHESRLSGPEPDASP